MEHMGIDPERCAHPGCCHTRPMYCLSHLQHDPVGQQMAEAHMHSQEEHMHPYAAELHSIQQMQQQSEVVYWPAQHE